MTETNKKSIYLPLILTLIGSFLLFSLWSAFQAAGLGSKVTDADYYSKGLKYNTTLVEKRAATVLGWNLTTRMDDRTLEFQLIDRDGSVVDGAAGSLYLAIPGAAENITLPLREVAAGIYRVSLDRAMTGSVRARLELERDGARLNRQLLLNI